MLKHKLLYEILAAVVIILVAILRFDFILGYINGSHELDWALDGFTDTNMSLRLIFLFGITGFGLYWLIWNYAKRWHYPVMIGSILISTVLMSSFFIFYYLIPMVVVTIIFIIKIKEFRRNNVKNSSDWV